MHVTVIQNFALLSESAFLILVENENASECIILLRETDLYLVACKYFVRLSKWF